MKNILIEFSHASVGLGDIICIIPYLEKFRIDNECLLFVETKNNSLFSTIFKKSYPNITFINNKNFIYDKKIVLQHDTFNIPLQQIFAKQLGYFDAPYLRPKVDSFKKERPIQGKYITMNVHSTSQLKYWNHPKSKRTQPEALNWNELCGMIRKKGYTPVVLEKDELFGLSPFYNGLPKKANKKIGLPIEDLINYIEHSEFFIGLSSGLIWLAHALEKPIVMISNFTEDWNEMDINLDDYIRITNKNVCHGCWNKVNIEHSFDYNDWYWCPKFKNTDRQFECHTSITPEYVFNKIEKWI